MIKNDPKSLTFTDITIHNTNVARDIAVQDRMKRVDESLAKQLERSIRLNCELRISIWNEAIEAAAEIANEMKVLVHLLRK